MQKVIVQNQKNNTAKREISSGVIVFSSTSEGPRFLLLYYGHNYWTFPRGKIEKEEKSFEAALRETKEETGLVKNDLHFIEYFKTHENWTFVKNGQKIFKTVIFYLAHTEERHIKIEEHSLGYGWFTYKEAQKIFVGEKNSENRRVVRQAYNFIQNRKRKKANNERIKNPNQHSQPEKSITKNPSI